MCWCCCDAKDSAIFELWLSVIMNMVLLFPGLFFGMSLSFGQIGIFEFILISTNTILVSLELKSFCGKSIKKWNLVMRIIWTVVAGLIVILYLIQLISCHRDACLIWERQNFDRTDLSGFIFSICLLIVGPMFFYGIFKSILLSKILKSQSELPQQLPLTEL